MNNRIGGHGGHPPIRKLSVFLRNCKIEKKYEITTYTVYYLRCGRNEMIIIECDKNNNCIETLRVKL